jgi:4-hydroxy-tetrahydrodipicolinate synthase
MQLLKGVGVALVTPFTNDESIDFKALERVIDFVINNGVNYVVSLGTTGETPTLSKEEKKALLQYTIAYVNNRVPVVAGAGGNHTKEIIETINSFEALKPAAILSASPYYNKPTQQGIYEHYKAIAQNTNVPLVLYNVPGRTARNMDAATTLQLAHEFKNIVGTKEAAGNIAQCQQILRDRPKDFIVLSGDDDLVLAQMGIGMDGVISVIANCLPKLFCDMVHNALQNNFVTARLQNLQMVEAYNLLFSENNPAGVKAFLAEKGLIENILRLPLTPATKSLQEGIKKYLHNV